jgi:hypothetical protein
MSRMNSRTRKKVYAHLASLYGERCAICKRKGTIDTLQIDHIDNSNHNNPPDDLSNYQLLCASDNSRKNPRGKGKRGRLSEGAIEIEKKRVLSAEMEKNEESESIFRHWLYKEMTTKGEMLLQSTIHSAAEEAHCSQQSVTRYMQKVCSDAGMYQVFMGPEEKKMISFRPEYEKHLRTPSEPPQAMTGTGGQP